MPENSFSVPSPFANILNDPEKRKELDSIFGVDTSKDPVSTSMEVGQQQAFTPDKQKELDDIFGVGSRSAVGEIATGIKRGVIGYLPQQIGQAAQWGTDPEGNSVSKSVNEWGKGLSDSAEERLNKPGNLLHPDQHNVVTNALASGGEMLVPSVAAPLVVGAGLAAAGAIAPELAVGGGAALALSSLAGAVPMGMSQAQQTYESVKKAGKVSDEEAKTAGWKSGAIETLGETIGTYLGGKLLGIGGKVLSKTAKAGVGSVLENATDQSLWKPYAKQLFETAIGETATEMGQSYGQAAIEKGAGVDTDPWDQAKAAISPTLGMTALLAPFGLAGHYRNTKKAESIDQLLSNPQAAPPEARLAVVTMLHKDMEDNSIPGAQEWFDGAINDVANGISVRREASPVSEQPAQTPDVQQPSIPGSAPIETTDSWMNAPNNESSLTSLDSGPVSKAVGIAQPDQVRQAENKIPSASTPSARPLDEEDQLYDALSGQTTGTVAKAVAKSPAPMLNNVEQSTKTPAQGEDKPYDAKQSRIARDEIEKMGISPTEAGVLNFFRRTGNIPTQGDNTKIQAAVSSLIDRGFIQKKEDGSLSPLPLGKEPVIAEPAVLTTPDKETVVQQGKAPGVSPEQLSTSTQEQSHGTKRRKEGQGQGQGRQRLLSETKQSDVPGVQTASEPAASSVPAKENPQPSVSKSSQLASPTVAGVEDSLSKEGGKSDEIQLSKIGTEESKNTLQKNDEETGRSASINSDQGRYPSGNNLSEYTTKRGKIIRGEVRTDLTKEQAQKIDPYTFKHEGGFFIREKHLENHPGTKTAQTLENATVVPEKNSKQQEAAQKVIGKTGTGTVATLTTEGRRVDGKPILPGDKFSTSSGRETTPYPQYSPGKTTKRQIRKSNQWLIDNAVAEAKSRGDDYNENIFSNTKADNFHQADLDSIHQYLFGEQPKVVPSILKNLSSNEAQNGERIHPPTEQGGKKTSGKTVAETEQITKQIPEQINGSISKNEVNTNSSDTEKIDKSLDKSIQSPLQEKIEEAKSKGLDQAELRWGDYEIRQAGKEFVIHNRKTNTTDSVRIGDIETAAIIASGRANNTPSASTEAPASAQEGVTSSGNQFANNKIFTSDAVARARERLAAKRNTLSSGFDPELMQDMVIIGGAHFEAGIRNFASWSKAVIADIGKEFAPFLRGTYENIRHYPNLNTEGISTHAEIEANLTPSLEAATIEEKGGIKNGQPADQSTVQGDNSLVSEEKQPGRTEETGTGEGATGIFTQHPADVQRTGNNDLSTNDTGPAGGLQSKGKKDQPGKAGVTGDGTKLPERVPAESSNYRITDADNLGKGGAKSKAKDNLKAINVMRELHDTGRPATPEQQASLVKYVGWGSSELANGMFPVSQWDYYKRERVEVYKEGWQKLGEDLKKILTPQEIEDAKGSTLNAYYTPQEVVSSMYRALERFGYDGKGRILEPGCGTGNFIGLLPDSFKDSRFTGVEMDPTTSGIAKLLYPGHDIRNLDFADFRAPDNFYDIAIGNPPFLDVQVTKDPAYAKNKFLVHDFFFAKSIDKVRPGGLMMLVTSKGTMDKSSDKARSYLSARADLIGAIRLPQTAFKENAGTDVVTDVIFLKKRKEGSQYGGQSWSELKEVKTKKGESVFVNEYFADHPDMVLGYHSLEGSRYRENNYTVTPKSEAIATLFDKAVQNLPENLYEKDIQKTATTSESIEVDFSPSSIKEGGFYLKNGNLLQKEEGVGQPVKAVGNKKSIITDYVKVRDAVRKVLYVQMKGLNGLEAAQTELNKAYDDFVKKNGPINKSRKVVRTLKDGSENVSYQYLNFNHFKSDPDAYLIASIERYNDEDGHSSKADIFSKQVIAPQVEPQIDSMTDALHVSLYRTGAVDMKMIANEMNVSEKEAIAGLEGIIYQDPDGKKWRTSDDYLSGNVRAKLESAKAAAAIDTSYEKNVKDLEKVQPEDIPPSRIQVNLGMPILDPSHIQEFAREVVEMGVEVSYLPLDGSWKVEARSGHRAAGAVSDYGTNRMSADVLLDNALNGVSPKVFDRDSDGKDVLNKDATQAALEKLSKIKERFRSWTWENADRTELLARRFNDQYNNTVKREFGGDYINKMQFPGMSQVKTPFEHQKRVAWRILQQGNTYMAHSVGAGKTIASIISGMEMKRLGIKKKPMWTVPNHMLKQFAGEFLELYPAAKVLVADEEQFSKENRNRFMGRVAAENWDAVIITHSAFKMIPMSADFQSQFIQEQMNDLEELLQENQGDRLKRKQLERLKKRLESRLKKVMSNENKDKGVNFEETGIDQLFVDEAHEFRKLDFATNQTNIKGIDPSGSMKAFDLYTKSKYLETLYPNRSLVMMSGTPITNTLGEIYSVQRFLQEGKLRELGLHNFDSWAATFGDMVTNIEPTPAGTYKAVSRFGDFNNLKSLCSMWAEIGDFIQAKDLSYLVRPEVKGGGRKIVVGESSDLQRDYKKELASRIKEIEARKGPPSKGDDIILSVITDGRHAAMDDRYIDPTAPDRPDSKMYKMLEKSFDIWQDTKSQGSTQMIFADLGVPSSSERRGFSVYTHIKDELVRRGVPANEISFMQDYKKSNQKQKLFRDMNDGKIRFLIGSSQAMGTGVNAQKKLVALHHFDPDTYLPANIEQREGRIVRQGNENKRVELYAYVTRGSYDETMWHFLESKQRFIDDFLLGNVSTDSATDIDGSADSFAQARAMSSDNPLAIELAGIQNELSRLESLSRAHIDDQRMLAYKRQGAQAAIPRLEESVSKMEDALSRRVSTKGEEFKATIGKKEFSERAKAGEAILKSLKKVDPEPGKVWAESLGTIGGFTLQGRKVEGIGQHFLELRLEDEKTHILTPAVTVEQKDIADTSPVGLMMRLENGLKDLDSRLTGAKNSLIVNEKQIKDSTERLGRKFEYQDQLSEKRKRQEEILKELQAEDEATRGQGQEDTTGDQANSEELMNSVDKWQKLSVNQSTTTGTDLSELKPDQRQTVDALQKNGKLTVIRADQIEQALLDSLSDPKFSSLFPKPSKGWYRFNNKEKTPMSDWNHAMFIEGDMFHVEHYGRVGWEVDAKDFPDEETLRGRIEEELKKNVKDEDTEYEPVRQIINGDATIKEVADQFFPEDIVNSAQAWDNDQYFMWFWDRIADKEGIRGVKTPDGAIAFYEEDISRFSPKYSQDGKIQGFALPDGRSFIVPENIEKGQLFGVVRHEVGVHVGKILHDQKGFNNILNNLESRVGEDSVTGRAITEAYKQVPALTDEQKARMSEQEQKLFRAEEALGYLVQKSPNIGFVQRVITMIKRALVQLGVNPDIFTAKDFAALADMAVRREAKEQPLRNAEGWEIINQFSQDAKMSLAKAKLVIQNLPAFKAWFGESKVVDENGEPLVVYHGTNSVFTSFDLGVLGKETKHSTAGMGIFFTKDPAIASAFSGEKWEGWPLKAGYKNNANVIPSYLSIKNPVRMTASEFVRDFIRSGGKDAVAQFVNDSKEKGYDGVIIEGDEKYKDVMSADEYGDDSYVAFNPTQIKSIFNSKWDGNNPDIMFAQSTPFQKVTEKLINSPAFVKWFGKSVIKNGDTPHILYHGTPGNEFLRTPTYDWIFDTNRPTKPDSSPFAGLGIFLGNDTIATGHAGPEGTVHPFFVRVENPLVITSEQLAKKVTDQESAKAFKKQTMELGGHDGIIIKDRGQVIAFNENQLKSADQNTGEFSLKNNDVRYAVARKEYDKSVNEAIGTYIEKFTDKPDLKITSTMLSTPEYYFQQHPATQKMFQAQLDRHTNKVNLENNILQDYVPFMSEMKKKFLDAYNRFANYIRSVDKNQKSFNMTHVIKAKILRPDGSTLGYAKTILEASRMISKDAKETGNERKDYKSVEKVNLWTIFDREGKALKDEKGQPIAPYENEQEAVQKMMSAESEDQKNNGFDDKVISMTRKFREMTNRAFDKMIADLRKVEDTMKALGVEHPTVDIPDESRRWAVIKDGSQVAAFSSEADARAAVQAASILERKSKMRPAEFSVQKKTDFEITDTVLISDFIAKMADLRGSYFPRQRAPGGVVLRAVKKGEDPFMKKYDLYWTGDKRITDKGEVLPERPMTKYLREKFNQATGYLPFIETLEKKARELQRQGYSISIEKDNSMPETVFEPMHMAATLDALFQKSKENAQDKGQALDEKGVVEVSKMLSSYIADIFKARGYMSSRIKRSPVYWAGFETDPIVAGTQYAKGVAGGISKRDAAKQMIAAITGRDVSWEQFQLLNPDAKWGQYLDMVEKKRLDPSSNKKMYAESMDWMQEMLRNDEQIDRIVGTLKGLAVVKFLGFRVSSAVVNATNMVLAVPATISSQSGGTIRGALNAIRNAMTQYYQYRRKNGNLSAEDRAVFQIIVNNGWDEAQFNQENAAVLMSKLGRGWAQFGEWSMKMFGAVEKVNRATTIFAAYKEIIKNNPGMDADQAIEKAKHVSDRAHGVYGKATMPSWVRGSNLLKMAYTFQKFNHNYLLNMKEIGLKGDYTDAAYMILAPAIMGGVGASLAGPLLFGLLGKVGVGGDDPEEAFYAWIKRVFGSDSIARHGLPGLIGLNLKGSLDMQNPFPKKLSELMGAPGAILTDTYKAAQHFKKGEAMKGTEALLPIAIGSAVKAVREGSEGVTTGSYGSVYYGSEPLKSNPGEQFVRALSFNPSRISGIREKQWNEKQVAAKYSEKRRDITAELKHYYLTGNGNFDQLMVDVMHYNDLVRGSGRADIPYLTPQGIRRAVIQGQKPTKTERMRVE